MPDAKLPPNGGPPLSVDDIDTAPDVVPESSTDVRVTPENYADKLAEVSERKERLHEELHIEAARHLNDLIKPSAKQAFTFMKWYCGAVFVLLVLHGFKIYGFSLPEGTLSILVGSTATTVIGLVGMVLTGIFIGARRK